MFNRRCRRHDVEVVSPRPRDARRSGSDLFLESPLRDSSLTLSLKAYQPFTED